MHCVSGSVWIYSLYLCLKKTKLKHFLLCCPALFFSFFNHHRRFRLVSAYVRKLLLEISPVRIQEPRGGLSKNNEIIYMSTLMCTDRQEMEPVCVCVCVYVPLYHLCICVRTDVHTKTQLQGNDICYLHSSISLSPSLISFFLFIYHLCPCCRFICSSFFSFLYWVFPHYFCRKGDR